MKKAIKLKRAKRSYKVRVGSDGKPMTPTEIKRAWRHENRERVNEISRRYYLSKKGHSTRSRRLTANRSQRLEQMRAINRRHVRAVTDSYVRTLLRSQKSVLSLSEYPPEILEIKRLHLRLKRLKQNQNQKPNK